MNSQKRSLLTIGQNQVAQNFKCEEGLGIRIFCKVNGELREVSLDGKRIDVATAIALAVQEFKLSHGVRLPLGSDLYELFVARRNGKPISDFPAIEKEQELSKVGYRNFYLCPAPMPEVPGLKKGSTTSIQSEITMDSKSSQEIAPAPVSKRSRLRKYLNFLCLSN